MHVYKMKRNVFVDQINTKRTKREIITGHCTAYDILEIFWLCVLTLSMHSVSILLKFIRFPQFMFVTFYFYLLYECMIFDIGNLLLSGLIYNNEQNTYRMVSYDWPSIRKRAWQATTTKYSYLIGWKRHTKCLSLVLVRNYFSSFCNLFETNHTIKSPPKNSYFIVIIFRLFRTFHEFLW